MIPFPLRKITKLLQTASKSMQTKSTRQGGRLVIMSANTEYGIKAKA